MSGGVVRGNQYGNDGGRIIHTLEACPEKAKHTKCPDGYVEWHEWAEKKAKTHRQIRCDGCGRFAIWVSKRKRAAAGSTETTPP